MKQNKPSEASPKKQKKSASKDTKASKGESRKDLTRKQKDDRKRASQSYRDRQKAVNEQNAAKVKTFSKQFECFCSILSDVCTKDQKSDILQRMEAYNPSNLKAQADGLKPRFSRSNSLKTPRTFGDSMKQFVGLDK